MMGYRIKEIIKRKTNRSLNQCRNDKLKLYTKQWTCHSDEIQKLKGLAYKGSG